MPTARDIIQSLGGTSEVASGLGISATTVSSWKSSNSIPDWRRSKLLELAASKGVPLSTTDFPSRGSVKAAGKAAA